MMGLKAVLLVVLVAIVGVASAARAEEAFVTGTATYREKIALSPGARFEATIEDIGRADAPATVLGSTTIDNPGAPPIAFRIPYDPAAIEPRATYSVRARVTVDGRLLFTSDRIHRVLTQGAPNEVTVPLRAVGKPGASALSQATAAKAAPTADNPRLVNGMFLYFADAARLTLCHGGRDVPVAMEGGYLELERAYTDARPGPQQPLLVSVVGGLAERPRMEGGGTEPTFIVERFVHAWRGETCEAQQSDAALVNTYWRIVKLGDEAVRAHERGREPHLLLHVDGARFNATVGCNQMVGGYTLAGDALGFGQAASTMMVCPPPLGEWEQALARVLEQTKRWAISGQVLELKDEEGKPLALLRAVHLR